MLVEGVIGLLATAAASHYGFLRAGNAEDVNAKVFNRVPALNAIGSYAQEECVRRRWNMVPACRVR